MSSKSDGHHCNGEFDTAQTFELAARLSVDNESTTTASTVHSPAIPLPVLPSRSTAANLEHIITKLAAALPRQARRLSPIDSQDVGDGHAHRALSGDHRERTSPHADCVLMRNENTHSVLCADDPPGSIRWDRRLHHRPTSRSGAVPPVPPTASPTNEPSDHATHDYESLSSEASGGSFASSVDNEETEVKKITRQWSKLRERRREFRSNFRRITGARDALADVRQRRNQKFRALMQAVGEVLNVHRQEGLEELFREAQGVDTEHRRIEANLDDLLDELEDNELKLEVEQLKFFTGIVRNEPDSPPPERTLSRPSSRTSLRGIKGERDEDIHPRFEEFQGALQELQLAREFKMNLNIKKRLAENQGVDIGPTEREFLQDYDGLYRQALDEIDHWTHCAEVLEEQCREKNLFPGNGYFQQVPSGDEPWFNGDLDLEEAVPNDEDSRSSEVTLAHPQFPLLLSNPSHLLHEPLPQTALAALRSAYTLPEKYPSRGRLVSEASKEYGIQTLLIPSKDEDKQDFINRWLFHRLRQSAIEVEHLVSTFRARLKILDWSQWQRDVIFFWSRDGAANQPTAWFEGIYGDPSLALTGPSSERTSHVSLQSWEEVVEEVKTPPWNDTALLADD